MSAVYLLPCPHGKHVEVTVADAGRTVECPCGKPVVVPTMREIRGLPIAPNSEPPRAQGADWSLQQGVMFSLGIVVLVGAVIAMVKLGYDVAQLDTKKFEISDEHLARWDDAIMHEMSAPQTLELYAILDQPLPQRRQLPAFEVNRARARQLYRYMMIAGGVGGLGLLISLAGIFMRPRQSKPARRKQQAKPT